MNHTPTRRILIAAILAGSLFINACGGDGSGTGTTDQPEPGTGETVTAGSEPPTTTGVSGEPALLCENPPPTEFGLGTPVASETTESLPTLCFWIEIPDGLESVSFDLTGLASDLNLAVGYGFLYTLQFNMGDFWPSRESGTADESIALENPAPGPYFVSVGPGGFESFSMFGLSATSRPEMSVAVTGEQAPDSGSCHAPATELTVGVPTTGKVVAQNNSEPRTYFCVEIPDGPETLTIELSDLDGNVDVFVRRGGTTELWVDRSRGGTERSVVVESPTPGAYQIEVAGDESTFVVTATRG